MSEQEYRADGWPLCPRCGEDELWTTAMSPVLADHFAREFNCYRCNWSGRLEQRLLDATPQPVTTAQPGSGGEEEHWTCARCNYMNAGPICTHCGKLRAVEEERE